MHPPVFRCTIKTKEITGLLVNIRNLFEKRAIKHSAIKLEVIDNKLFVYASDNATQFVAHCDVQEATDGVAIVRGEKLRELLLKIDAEYVHLSPEITQYTIHPTLLLEAGNSKSRWTCLDNGQYSLPFDRANFKSVIQIDNIAFREALDRTQHAASVESVRYYLNGINMTHKDNTLSLTATDGHRLARMGIDCHLIDQDRQVNFTISNRAARVLMDITHDRDTTLDISINENCTVAKFTLDEVEIITSGLDGIYPNVERVIPTGGKQFIKFNAQDMIKAIELIGAVDKTAIRLERALDAITIFSKNSPTGYGNTNIEIIDTNMDSLYVGYNPKYLHTLLRKIKGEHARLQFDTDDIQKKPTLVVDEADIRMIYVLMPMKVTA